ncbi:MAG: hypothetical protein QXZ68_05560 [Candidatus Bathyarchaeia archaeon]
MSLAVLVAPSFDEASRYSYEWSREIVNHLQAKGFKVTDLSGRTVSRNEVEEALKQNPGAFLIFYNHGSEDCLWGSRTEKVVDLENVWMLSGREVYTCACLSAKKLGVKAYAEDCTAYWGYTDVFAFTTEALEEFKQFANIGIIIRIEGKSWLEAYEQAKALAEKLAEKLVSEGKYFSAVLIRRDAEILACYTEEHPPETKCLLRRIAVNLFGAKKGWKLGWNVIGSEAIHAAYGALTVISGRVNPILPLTYLFSFLFYQYVDVEPFKEKLGDIIEYCVGLVATTIAAMLTL